MAVAQRPPEQSSPWDLIYSFELVSIFPILKSLKIHNYDLELYLVKKFQFPSLLSKDQI